MSDKVILHAISFIITNKLFELANVPAEIRQQINDEADEFIIAILTGKSEAFSGPVSKKREVVLFDDLLKAKKKVYDNLQKTKASMQRPKSPEAAEYWKGRYHAESSTLKIIDSIKKV